MNVLSLRNVSKRFGSLKVIDGLSFDVEEGIVFGFVGKNGAGKTTTMKMILGLLACDSGTIRVCDEEVAFGETATNRHIGYLPDVPEFYGYMKAKEYLALCGEITGLSSAQIRSRSDELLGLVGLSGVERKISTYSRGMKQRLGIAQALLNSPKLLICDEPTSALDPIGRSEILSILHAAKKYTTVLFSTHILSDVERICDRVGILNDGKLMLEGDLGDIKSRHRENTVTLEFESNHDLQELQLTLSNLPFVSSVELQNRSLLVRMSDTTDGNQRLLEHLTRSKLPLLKFEVGEPTLESLFMEIIK